MQATEAKEVLDKIVGVIFGYQNPLSLEQAMAKFAFDLRLPQQVYDATTNEPTWAASVNPTRFMTMDNCRKRNDVDDWMLPKRPLNNLQEAIAAWSETNFTSTDRHVDSVNVGESDSIYGCENIYRSTDIRQSKNILFSEGGSELEFVAAGSRSNTSTYCIRVEDSQQCYGSFNVIFSGKVTNSFFIQDSYDLMDCMFCSHIAGKRFCIANMQFEEEEYMKIKKEVIQWILTP